MEPLTRLLKHFSSPFAQIATGTGAFVGLLHRTDAEKILLIAVTVVIVLDWVTGIAASYKEGIPIKSKRMREAVPKLIAYASLIVLVLVTGEVLKAEGINITVSSPLCLVCGLIFGIEGHSVLENIVRITGIKVPWLDRILYGLQEKEPQLKGKTTNDAS